MRNGTFWFTTDDKGRVRTELHLKTAVGHMSVKFLNDRNETPRTQKGSRTKGRKTV